MHIPMQHGNYGQIHRTASGRNARQPIDSPWCGEKHPGWAHLRFCQGALVKALTAWEISTFPSTTCCEATGKREEKEGPRGRIRPYTGTSATQILEICCCCWRHVATGTVPGWHPWLLLWQERSQDRRAGLQTDSMGARKFLERLADGCAQRASTGCWPQGFPWGCRTPNPEEARGGAQSPQRRTEIPAGSQGGSREGQSRWQWGIHRSCSTPQTGGRPPEKWDQSSPPPSIPKGAGNPRKVDPKRIWLGCRSGSHPLARHCQISASPGWILHPTTSGSEKQEGSGEC